MHRMESLISRMTVGMVVLTLLITSCSENTGPSSAAFFADRIAFSYSVENTGTTLATVNPDGSDIREVSLPANFKSSTIGGIAWTRDHRWLVFSATLVAEMHSDLFVVRPTGSIPANVTQTADLDEDSPAWSPDGRQIAFERDAIIFIINADGSSERELVGPNPSNTGNHSPDWSPDGTTIVYATGNNEAIWTVSTIDPAEPLLIRDIPAIRGRPTWKPDGSQILFWEHGITDPTGPKLMAIAPDGSDPEQISSTIVGYTPVWSPDGIRIAVVGIQEPNIGFSVLNLGTSEVVPLELPDFLGSFAWK
jgi:Tol biopolymer transport system component